MSDRFGQLGKGYLSMSNKFQGGQIVQMSDRFGQFGEVIAP